MVVRVAVTTGRRARRDYWSLLRAAVLLAGIAVPPTPTQSAGFSATESPNRASPFASGGSAAGALRQTQAFDPAAAALSSMMSYGAMSVIAPTLYGDFVSPTALSFALGLSGVGSMPQTMGLDPATSTMLDGVLQQGVPPGGGSAEEFGVGASGAGVALSGVVAGLSGGVSTISGAGGLWAISSAEAIQPLCSDNQMAKRLQAGGEFWNAQGVSDTRVRFPQGVFTGIDVGNPLGGLGPSGNPSNLSPPGPGGGWCRPSPGPFSVSSPLESRFFWIVAFTMLFGVVVFWLSRGMKVPTPQSINRCQLNRPCQLRGEKYGSGDGFGR